MNRFAIVCLAAVASFGSPAAAQDSQKPIKALLVVGGCCHDYAKQKDILTQGISARTPVEWTISYEKDTTRKVVNPIYASADWAKGFDVVLHDECTGEVRDLAVIDRILEPHRNGLPAVVLHCGMHSYKSEPWPKRTPWHEFTGLITTAHGAQAPIALDFVDKSDPITKGMVNWTTINEELYNNIAGNVEATAHPLIRGKQTTKSKDGKEKTDETTVCWTNLYKGKTKVFATTLGHNNATCADARYLDLVTRGMLWAVGRDPAIAKSAAK